MKLRLTRRAAQDLIEIAEYIRVENPNAAENVRASIIAAMQTLVRFPRLGRPQTTGNVRKLVTPRYGYVVYYMPDEARNEVIVLTIQHPSRLAPVER